MEVDIKFRCRSILIQIYEAEDVRILKGIVSTDHVHMHVEYRPSQSVSDLVRRLKGRNSRELQQEFPELKTIFGTPLLGDRFWLLSTGNITDEMVNEYL